MGGIMKKIILILCVIMTTTVVHATQMCARRNTTVIPLDATVDVKGAYTVGGSDPVENMWWIPFLYGTLYGINTCLSVPEIQEYVPEWSGSGDLPIVPGGEEMQGRSEIYTASDGTVYDRRYCYCKLIHPMSSQWVYTSKENASVDRNWCAKRCYFACLYDSANTASLGTIRSKLFISIGYDSEEIDGSEYDESINLN